MMLEDERFKNVHRDVKYRRMPKRDNKIKIDSRFKAMFTDEKFKIKGTKDKRGRDMIATSNNEDLKRYYDLQENIDDLDEELPIAEKEKLVDQEVSSTDSDISESEEHKWGELDADCSEIDEATCRLAVCNMSWDLMTAKDLYILFDNLKPIGGLVQDVKIYMSEYGKKMKADENKLGPFALIEKLDPRHQHKKYIDETISGDNEEENFDIEKLREYQINRMKYAYAIVVCDSPETAQHLYNECNGLEFEKTSNIMDLRYVPDATKFNDISAQDILSQCNPQMSSLTGDSFTKSGNDINFNVLNSSAAKCLSQSKFDITWDKTDPRREFILQKSLAPLYNDAASSAANHDKIGKSRSKVNRRAKSEMMNSLLSDVHDKELPEKGNNSVNRLHEYLAPPSSSSSFSSSEGEGEDSQNGFITQENSIENHLQSKKGKKNNKTIDDKYQKYRALLSEVLEGNSCKDEEEGKEEADDYDVANKNDHEEINIIDNSHFSEEDDENVANEKCHKTKTRNKVMQITWEPELSELTREKIQKKLSTTDNNSGETPWEKYLTKQKDKRRHKKLEKMTKIQSSSTKEDEDGDDRSLFNNESKAAVESGHISSCEGPNESETAADLELLMMDDDAFFTQNPVKSRQFSEASTLNAPLSSRRIKKKRLKTGENLPEVDVFEQLNQNDARFSALRNDPRYALDPSHPNFKTTLAAISKRSHKFQNNKKYKLKKYKNK